MKAEILIYTQILTGQYSTVLAKKLVHPPDENVEV